MRILSPDEKEDLRFAERVQHELYRFCLQLVEAFRRTGPRNQPVRIALLAWHGQQVPHSILDRIEQILIPDSRTPCLQIGDSCSASASASEPKNCWIAFHPVLVVPM